VKALPEAAVVVVTLACAFRFIFDGVTFVVMQQTVTIGHTDPLAYGAILAPTFAAYGYSRVKNKTVEDKK
jgi:hypothetical protein